MTYVFTTSSTICFHRSCVLTNLLGGGGGSNPIFAHRKMVKKVYGKKGKSIHFPLFPYTFFPISPHGIKWENTHFSMG